MIMNVLFETERLVLKALDDSGDNCRKVLNFLEKGRDVFEKYEMKKVPLYYTDMYQRSVLSTEYAATVGNRYIRYYVFLKDDPGTVIGTVSCGNIMQEPYCSGTIGYKFDEDYWHKGYAREALKAMVGEVFKELKLHRLIAYVMEHNAPSIKLLEAVGFRMEGLCQKNLIVNGVWENHMLYAMLNPDEEHYGRG